MKTNLFFLISLICFISITSSNNQNTQQFVACEDNEAVYGNYEDYYGNYYSEDEDYVDDFDDDYYDDEEECDDYTEEFEGKVVNVDDDYFEKYIKPNVDSNMFDMRIDPMDPKEEMQEDMEFERELEKYDDDTLLDELNMALTGKKPEKLVEDVDYGTVCIDDFLDDFIAEKEEENGKKESHDEEIEAFLKGETNDLSSIDADLDGPNAEYLDSN
jgi:hypothetical protein